MKETMGWAGDRVIVDCLMGLFRGLDGVSSDDGDNGVSMVTWTNGVVVDHLVDS